MSLPQTVSFKNVHNVRMLKDCLSSLCCCQKEFVVIDLEGFNLKSLGFVVKELSISSEFCTDTIFFKPPCSLQSLPQEDRKTVDWLSHSLHGIAWQDGYYSYCSRFSIFKSLPLRFPRASFFAKGAEKCALLRDLLNTTVTNLETVNCPKISKIASSQFCNCHKHKFKSAFSFPFSNCAQKKAEFYYRWLRSNYDSKLSGTAQAADLLVRKFANLCISEHSESSSSSHAY